MYINLWHPALKNGGGGSLKCLPTRAANLFACVLSFRSRKENNNGNELKLDLSEAEEGGDFFFWLLYGKMEAVDLVKKVSLLSLKVTREEEEGEGGTKTKISRTKSLNAPKL